MPNLVTIVMVNIRRIQPKTRDALMAAFESGKSVALIECDRDELDGFKVIPFSVVDPSNFKALVKPPRAANKKKETASTDDAIAALVGEAEAG